MCKKFYFFWFLLHSDFFFALLHINTEPHIKLWTLNHFKGAKTEQKAATYTLCGGDVHVAANKGQTVIHAHLEINHPGTKKTQTKKIRCRSS